jgi:ankyrin repeat protein
MKRIFTVWVCLLVVFSWALAEAVETNLQAAIQAGDLLAVKKMVSKDKTILKIPNERGRTALHTACFEGKLDIVKYLLKAGSSVRERDTSYQLTPLHFAAWNGHVEVAKYLLSKGADLNARENDSETPLYYAAGLGRLPMIEFLVSRGADVNDSLSRVGNTVVSLALERRQPEAAQLLIRLGGPVKMSSRSRFPTDWTLMHTAAWEGGKDLIDFLAEHDVPVDQKSIDDRTPLHNACLQGNMDGARALVGRGADVNASSAGRVPLYMAAAGGFTDLVAFLIKSGASVQWTDSASKRSLLHYAVIKGYQDIVNLLLDSGADPNAKDINGATALDYAYRYGQASCLQSLKGRGARASSKNAAKNSQSLLKEDLTRQQAMVCYLSHSGWAVRTSNHWLVFDYVPRRRQSDDASLINGVIAPAELAGQNAIVFVSHAHGDHYSPAIFDFRKDIPNISYVMGFEPRDQEGYSRLTPQRDTVINGATITAIESNEGGQGFLVTVDGVTVCHLGDHANRKRDFSEPYKEAIDFIAGLGRTVDILFVPVTGCNFGDVEAVRMGDFYAMDKLRPRAVFPMHGGDGGDAYFEFAREAVKAKVATPVHCLEYGGDHMELMPVKPQKQKI